MAPQTDTYQDDYYAQVKTAATSDDGAKKPLKLKLKAVVKKPTESEAGVSPILDIPTPTVTVTEEVVIERPKARLIEREHASE
jgi:hypothetical protein